VLTCITIDVVKVMDSCSDRAVRKIVAPFAS